MATSVYQLNKGINQPILFRGLKAQYIGYLAAGLVALLLLFAGMYLAGVPIPISLGTILVLGAGLFTGVYHLSHTYGEHGLLKRMARQRVPGILRIRSRRPFLNLSNPEQTTHDKDN